MKPKYIVKVLENNEWSTSSYHKNFEYAQANAEVKFTAGYPVQIVHDGRIIFQKLESEP